VYRIGLGIDIHRFEAGRKLVLGGIEIPHDRGLAGHSDADCVLHALCDGLLGACALGDIGQHFPPNEENKDRSSIEILKVVCQMVWARGFKIVNVDLVMMAEEPKLSPFRDSMAELLAPILNIERSCVGIKATTCEGLGSIGRKEGLMAQAVVLLEKKKYD
jgi:2-C-methyl-D-erythritol 2,4-cyclodiphosphate synthase